MGRTAWPWQSVVVQMDRPNCGAALREWHCHTTSLSTSHHLTLNITPPHSQHHTTSLSMSHHLTAQSGHYTLLLLSCHCLPYSVQRWVAQPQSTVWIPMVFALGVATVCNVQRHQDGSGGLYLALSSFRAEGTSSFLIPVRARRVASDT